MSSREAILGRIRTALTDSPDTGTETLSRSYRDVPDSVDVTGLFVERVADYLATVVRCAESEVPAAIADAVGSKTVVLPNGFPWPIDASADDGLTHNELDAIDAVVTTATIGIAETGTLVLDHGPGQGRRALTLVPDSHICVIRASQVVAGVSKAVAALDATRPQTWISGPSATSDIELTRVEGVHGPRNLHVIVVDDR
jgi:L-lactate dehydrogenase complex protein LldG